MPKETRSAHELSILRAMIFRAETVSSIKQAEAGDISQVVHDLAGHRWSDEEHRVVFECLRASWGQQFVRLREEMAARATRMGHPDVDWDLYFGREGGNIDLPAMIRSLRD